jgi:hypothetical protein
MVRTGCSAKRIDDEIFVAQARVDEKFGCATHNIAFYRADAPRRPRGVRRNPV